MGARIGKASRGRLFAAMTSTLSLFWALDTLKGRPWLSDQSELKVLALRPIAPLPPSVVAQAPGRVAPAAARRQPRSATGRPLLPPAALKRHTGARARGGANAACPRRCREGARTAPAPSTRASDPQTWARATRRNAR